jgi:hypothetical protein
VTTCLLFQIYFHTQWVHQGSVQGEVGEGEHQEGVVVGEEPEEDFLQEEGAEEHQEVVGDHVVEEGVVEVEWVQERRWWWSHTGTQESSLPGGRRMPW